VEGRKKKAVRDTRREERSREESGVAWLVGQDRAERNITEYNLDDSPLQIKLYRIYYCGYGYGYGYSISIAHFSTECSNDAG
jgi:hypothetical protein